MACQSRPLRDKLRARLRVFVMKMKHLRQCRLASYSTKSKNAHRNREYGLKVMKSMTDDDFQRMFRVTSKNCVTEFLCASQLIYCRRAEVQVRTFHSQHDWQPLCDGLEADHTGTFVHFLDLTFTTFSMRNMVHFGEPSKLWMRCWFWVFQ